jgi:ABC-type transport system involved in cytochrome c biogenesis permease component
MSAPAPPPGLVRSLALLCGATLTIAAGWRMALPVVAMCDLASAVVLVGGSGIVAWAAARIALVDHLTAPGAFAAGLVLPLSIPFLLPRRPRGAANDNDHPFSGSWPQFISE